MKNELQNLKNPAKSLLFRALLGPGRIHGVRDRNRQPWISNQSTARKRGTDSIPDRSKDASSEEEGEPPSKRPHSPLNENPAPIALPASGKRTSPGASNQVCAA